MYLSGLIERTLDDLKVASCVDINNDFYVTSTYLGQIASYYYLSYKTMGLLNSRISKNYKGTGNPELGEHIDGDFAGLLRILSDVPEYDELPVRHNEDLMNESLEKKLPVRVSPTMKKGMSTFGGKPVNVGFEDSHVKAFLLLQAHLNRLRSLPCSDYAKDTTSVLDQAIRIIQAMIDVAAEKGYLVTCRGIMNMLQCIKQSLWPSDSNLLSIPKMTHELLDSLFDGKRPITRLSDFSSMNESDISRVFNNVKGLSANECTRMILNLPWLNIRASIEGANLKEGGMWMLECGKEYELNLQLERKWPYIGASNAANDSLRAYTPLFPKPQYEGWFVLLSTQADNELLALKRLSSVSSHSNSNRGANKDNSLKSTIKFSVPYCDYGTEIMYILEIISDCYVGIDQMEKILVLTK